MMYGRVVLGEVVYHIVLSNHPIYQKLSLSDSFFEPVKFHVYGYWMLLEDIVVDKSVFCDTVRQFWIGQLRVANIC